MQDESISSVRDGMERERTLVARAVFVFKGELRVQTIMLRYGR